MGKHWASLQMQRSAQVNYRALLLPATYPLVFIASNHTPSLVFISRSCTSQAASPVRASTSCRRIRGDFLFFMARPAATAYCLDGSLLLRSFRRCSTRVREAAPKECSGKSQNFKHPMKRIFLLIWFQSSHKGKTQCVCVNSVSIRNRSTLAEAGCCFPLFDTKTTLGGLLLLFKRIHN